MYEALIHGRVACVGADASLMAPICAEADLTMVSLASDTEDAGVQSFDVDYLADDEDSDDSILDDVSPRMCEFIGRKRNNICYEGLPFFGVVDGAAGIYKNAKIELSRKMCEFKKRDLSWDGPQSSDEVDEGGDIHQKLQKL